MTLTEALSYSLPSMLLLLGESNMYQRFFSARDPQTAKRSVIGWLSGTIILETLIAILAVIASSIFLNIESEKVILFSVKNGVPLAVGALLLAAIVATIVSTADSFLLVPSINVMRDFYQKFFSPNPTPKKMILYSRIVVVLLGIVAFLQVRFFKGVLEMALYAYTMYGVGITPAVLACFFWKRVTPAGGVVSIASGMGTTLIWELLNQPNDIPTVYPALLMSLSGLVIVSLLTRPSAPEKWQPFFENKRNSE